MRGRCLHRADLGTMLSAAFGDGNRIGGKSRVGAGESDSY